LIDYARMTCVRIFHALSFAGFVLLALPRPALAGSLYAIGLPPGGQIVFSPLTTRMRVNVQAAIPSCSTLPLLPLNIHEQFIDIPFQMYEPCFTIDPPTPRGFSGYFGFLPAGTYVARMILISPQGAATVAETLTFEVLEAGPPLEIPTLNPATLAILAILLAAFGVIAARRGA
jgi:hypothetical protein